LQDGERLAQALDRCVWRDLPERVVIAPSAFLADRLRREIRSVLADFGASIEVQPTQPSRRTA
jgi:hypothetical protein